MSILYILAALLLLGILVTIHEGGHFFAARLTGIPVKEYSIGLGPKIVSWKSRKHETQFFLRLIPAGGYCMFYGEDDTQEKEKDDPRAIHHYAVWRRIVTVAAGPAMNFVLALAVAAGIILAQGDVTYDGYILVDSVAAGSPAEAAGFLPRDVIVSVNGEDAGGLVDAGVGGKSFKAIALIGGYEEGDAPLTIQVRRDGGVATLQAAPLFDAAEGRYMLGIGLLPEEPDKIRSAPVSLPRAIGLGAETCVRASGAILSSLRELVTTGKGFEQSSGPVGIIRAVAENTQAAARESAGSAVATYAQLLVLISVNLGLFNLIPIPGLDGSRIVFLLIEGVRRRPVPRKVEAYVHMGGYLLLFGLMILMTFKDVLKIFR